MDCEVLATVIGAVVWRPFAGLITLTMAVAAFFTVHGIVQILTSLAHRQLFTRSWPWMAISSIADLRPMPISVICNGTAPPAMASAADCTLPRQTRQTVKRSQNVAARIGTSSASSSPRRTETGA